MRVFLLRISGERRPVFYAEAKAALDSRPRDPSGRITRGWAERQLRKLQVLILYTRRHGNRRFPRLWSWLDRRPLPDEKLLHALKTAEAVDLSHPSAMTSSSAGRYWRHYLSTRYRQHLVTLLWDLLLSPLALLIMILPGPNVLGYWFAYRILSHVLALRGIARVRGRRFPVRFLPSPALDPLLPAKGQGPETALLSATLHLPHLPAFLARRSRRHQATAQPST